MRGRIPWRWVIGAAVLVLAAIGVYQFWGANRGFNWNLFFSTILQLHWGWLVLSVVFALATYYGRALRWAVLLAPVKPKPNMRNLFTATVIGFTAVVLLGRPGEFVRPYLIALKEKVSVSSQLAAWLLERIFDLLIALVIFGVALSQVKASGVRVGPQVAWVLAVGGHFVGVTCLICLGVLIAFRHFAEPARKRIQQALAILPEHWHEKARRTLNAFVNGVESTKDDRSTLLLAGYTVLEWILIAACYACLFRALGDSVSFRLLDVIIFMGFVSFGAIVQIPGVGGGVQVASIVVLTQLFYLSLEVATSVAVLVHIITFVVIVPFGLALTVHEGLSLRKIERIAEQQAHDMEECER